MKKILIANNNMCVGGVQKSLYNLLWSIEGHYDVTLFLFRAIGTYANQLPPWVKVIEASSLFRFLGVSQGACVGLDKLKRGSLAALCRVFGRPAVMKIILSSQKMLEEEYDCAIAFLHNGNERNFYGGVQEFVLDKVKARKKVAFLHCDYRRCGANMPGNHVLLKRFDRIAACSEGCRDTFCSVLPELADRCTSVRNFHRIDEIKALARENTVVYSAECHNLIMVSRLAHEKGIERAIEAVANAVNYGIPVMLHIVGGGPMEAVLRKKMKDCNAEEFVRFYGEQGNPYRYMKNADLFLMTSFHEAAPMVIDEAVLLGLPVLTPQTTSSQEMVIDRGVGWVCENNQMALNDTLMSILDDPEGLHVMTEKMRSKSADNRMAIRQFAALIEE